MGAVPDAMDELFSNVGGHAVTSEGGAHSMGDDFCISCLSESFSVIPPSRSAVFLSRSFAVFSLSKQTSHSSFAFSVLGF